MTEKTRKAFTIDRENAEFLETFDNQSAKVNSLLTAFREGGDVMDEAIQRYRLESERAELRSLEKEAEHQQERVKMQEELVADLEQSLKREADKQEDILTEAADALADTPRSALDEDNPAVENWARKAGLSPAEFLDWYRTEHLDTGDGKGGADR